MKRDRERERRAESIYLELSIHIRYGNAVHHHILQRFLVEQVSVSVTLLRRNSVFIDALVPVGFNSGTAPKFATRQLVIVLN